VTENTGVTEFVSDPRPLLREEIIATPDNQYVNISKLMYMGLKLRDEALTPDAGCDTIYKVRMLVRIGRKMQWLSSMVQRMTDGD
jgi:hypothetical protein